MRALSVLALTVTAVAVHLPTLALQAEAEEITIQERQYFTAPKIGSTIWVGIAAEDNSGRAFINKNHDTEAQGHNAVITECQRETLRTCSKFIAIPQEDSAVAIHCIRGNLREAFVGGSKKSMAYEVALGKARNAKAKWKPNECRVTGTY